MRKHLLGLMLIAGLAGCTSESDSDLAGTSDATAKTGVAASGAPTQASLAALRGATTNFASLPDRGELLSYGGARKARQSGAYTYHPVAISEAHALNAIGGGEMVVNTPDGQALRLKYERHEEQPDGNWTWIGSSPDGSTAVLTFGEKAVFGMVSKGDDYYRVRTDRTGAWVVATDRSLVASNGGRREKGEDFLLPPEGGMLTAAASRHLAKAEPAAAVPEKAAAVVDVLIGYSNGLASAYGSQAAAATFVTSLVAMTNAAYANSGVNMRLRAVHTLQVNYADTSDNQDALQQLTGYNATTQQPITPNAAFNALRAARDEYGADLVAFVRRYREPEQDGCGIAWLLGMNQSGISAAADAEFGYAVISDGEDRDESDNNTYFCSDYSLAHELGHLMGQAHNSQDAQGRAGAHTYSYGYRESSATGFHTIMAYPSGDSQVEIPYFANPLVNFASGRPTGVANQSDNARSMNITMPIVATFRDTVVPYPSYLNDDMDGDGVSEVFWRNRRTGQVYVWWKGVADGRTSPGTVSDLSWRIVGSGDFDGDGKADLFWRNTSNGKNIIWPDGSKARLKYVTTVSSQSWQVVGVADFDGDGKSDIFWRNSATGQNIVWWSGSYAGRTNEKTVDKAWKVVGTGDFNNDGKFDVLWRNSSNGQNIIWWSGKYANLTSLKTIADKNWTVVAVGDLNGDGGADIFWSNTSTGQTLIWWGGQYATRLYEKTLPLSWKVVDSGDYNGDGKTDLYWRNSQTGENIIWWSGRYAGLSRLYTVADQSWVVEP